MMRIVDIWEASGDTDMTEGRGGKRHLGYFLHEGDAKKVAAHEGCQGGPGYVDVRKMVTEDGVTGYIIHGVQAITVATDSASHLRLRALAKLSPTERAALGL